jgi:GNAT superfamily N-acetyltransferase
MNWYKQATSIQFDSSEGIHEIKMGPAKLVYQVLNDGTVSLSSLRVPRKYQGQGYAKALLLEFTRWLDKEGLSSSLGASPLDKRTSPQRLEEMYAEFGYELTGRNINLMGDKEMSRSPQKNELV